MISSQAPWFLSRATGTVGLVLLTVVVVLGLVTSGRRNPHGESATVVMAMHRWLSLGTVAFVAVHVLTAVADGYAPIGLAAALIPFTSSYQTFWVALGTLAVDLMVVLVVTGYFRHRLAERVWRLVHWLSYAMWPVAVVHGFGLGSSDEPLLRWTTVACAAVAAGTTGWRWTSTHHDREARRAVAAGQWR